MERDALNRDAFHTHMFKAYGPGSDLSHIDGKYVVPHIENHWTTWKESLRAEARYHVDEASRKAESTAPERNASVFRAEVRDAMLALVAKYVNGDGGIAMVAANGGAHPAVRESWSTVANWLDVSSVRQIDDDLLAIGAVTGASVTNVTNLTKGAKLKKFKFPMKKFRKALRRELKDHVVDVTFDPEALRLHAADFDVIGERTGTLGFNGSNGDPSVVLTLPSMHDGEGQYATTRFTGVIENEDSGERWLVNTTVSGNTSSPYVREADVTRIPD